MLHHKVVAEHIGPCVAEAQVNTGTLSALKKIKGFGVMSGFMNCGPHPVRRLNAVVNYSVLT